MVVDTLENLEKYASLNPLFAQAIEFLKSHDLQAMEIGKTELKGKDLLVNIAQTNLLSDVGTAMLSKSLDMAETMGASMTDLLDSAAMERSVNPDLGANIGISI